MKKLYFLFVALAFCSIFGCGSNSDNGSNSKGKISNLNILTGNAAFVKTSNLAQIGTTSSKKSFSLLKTSSGTEGITDVTTESGETVTVTSAVQVNSRYIFLHNLTTTDMETTTQDYILDITTGNTVSLPFWPSNTKKIASNADHAFFVSGGTIYDITLATGDAVAISSSCLYWTFNPTDGYKSTPGSSWGSSGIIYISASNQLYLVQVDNISSGCCQGRGARFTYSNGTWSEDTDFNSTYFKSCPSSFPDQVPGCSLAMTQWILANQDNSALYHIVFSGTTVNVYNYNMDTFSNGTLVYTGTVSTSLLQTTYMGYNDSIQGSIMTNGSIILKFGSSGFVETIVPSDIPATNSIILTGGYVSQYGAGAVTNWNILDDVLYFLDPADSKVYKWDMISAYVKTEVVDTSSLSFLY